MSGDQVNVYWAKNSLVEYVSQYVFVGGLTADRAQ